MQQHAVISAGPRVERTSEAAVLSQRERAGLRNFDLDMKKAVFLESITYNGVLIRVACTETSILTRDSIVCCRFQDDDDDDMIERLFFGEVRHVLQVDKTTSKEDMDAEDVLVCCQWWDCKNPTEDQRAGFEAVEIVPLGMRQQGVMWVCPDQLLLQKHFLVSGVRANEAWIGIKI